MSEREKTILADLIGTATNLPAEQIQRIGDIAQGMALANEIKAKEEIKNAGD